MSDHWVNDGNAALLTDLYQLTMLQAYHREHMAQTAVFDLFVRRLPPDRNYLVACGLDDVLRFLENFRFSADAIEYLASLDRFSMEFLDLLTALRFRGDVYAVAEGTAVFANEPIIEVVAPLPEAQIVETFLLNQVSFQTMVASKASRVVTAAATSNVVEFGLRRLHGTDAGMKAARASFIAGAVATSNVLAGKVYGIPVAGTMAHSYIETHDSELDAFRAFVTLYPGSTLLVDTYDTLQGVRNVIRLAEEMGEEFDVRAVRLDSGDLAALAVDARRLLDDAGLHGIEIFASGSLDEYRIKRLLDAGAPINGFGVGTRMGVSADHPSLDTAYKLVEYAGRSRMKLSTGKSNLPGRKQVFRTESRDEIALHDETVEGRPLLVKAMHGGIRTDAGTRTLRQIAEHARAEIERLPAALRGLDPVAPHPVTVSAALSAEVDRCRREHGVHQDHP